MTACVCMGGEFGHVACRMRQEALTCREAVKRGSCGGDCSACLPDLETYLAATALEAGIRKLNEDYN